MFLLVYALSIIACLALANVVCAQLYMLAQLSFPTRRSSDLLAFSASRSRMVWPLASWSPRLATFPAAKRGEDRKSTRLNSSHVDISYAVFCLKKKRKIFYNFTLKNIMIV